MSYYDKLNNSLPGEFEKKANKITNSFIKCLGVHPKTNKRDQQIFSVFLFGIINALAYELNIEENEIQIVMIRLLINKLGYSIKDSVEFCQLLLISTNQENDPIAYKIIQSGVGAFFEFENKQYKLIKKRYYEAELIVSEVE